MSNLDVEALLDATAKNPEKKPKSPDAERSKDDGKSDRRDRDSDRDHGRERDGSRVRDRDRDYDRRRRDRRDYSLTRSRRETPDAGTPRSDTGSHKKTAITIEVDDARDPVRPLDTIALAMIAIAETDETDPTVTPMITAVAEMMIVMIHAMREAMPRLRKTSETDAPSLSSSLLLGCGLVN